MFFTFVQTMTVKIIFKHLVSSQSNAAASRSRHANIVTPRGNATALLEDSRATGSGSRQGKGAPAAEVLIRYLGTDKVKAVIKSLGYDL